MHLKFDKVRKQFGYGLVKISRELKIIDKNEKAESTHIFPKRVAGIMKILEDGGKSIFSLSDKAGDSTVVSLSDGIKKLDVLAIREENGDILLLMHPLITAAAFSRNGTVSLVYGKNLLEIIYGEKNEKAFSVGDIFNFTSPTVKRLMLVTTAVGKISEKLGNSNFKNSITVNFEGIESSLSLALDFTALTYALAEILSLENTFSDGKSSSIVFSSNRDTFDIILKMKAKKKLFCDNKSFALLFSEALRIVDVDANVEFNADSFIFAKASIKTELTTSYVREPGVLVGEMEFGYFDYCMDYYGILEN